MRKRRVRHQAEETLWRTVEVKGVEPRVGVHPMTERGAPPYLESSSWLDVKGTLDSPVKGVSDIAFGVYPREALVVGSARPVAVGAIIGIRETVDAVVPLLPADFDRLWNLALSGHLRFASLTLTPPKYGRALVVNTSFSSVREE